MIKRMTDGNPYKVLILFALPMILSVTFQQLYNIADSIIAGKFIGNLALASISASYPITMIFIAIGTGSGIGIGVVVSNFFGAKRMEKVKTVISTSIISIIILSVVLSVLGMILSKSFLTALNTPSEIISEANRYLMIYCGGLLFLFLYNAVNSIFQALGNSKTPLFFLFFSSALNIALDYYFVKYCQMGILGIAWATFISQGLSCLLSSVFLYLTIKGINVRGESFFSWILLKKVLFLAVPSIVQASIVSIGQLFVQGLVNGYGADCISAFGSSFKINMLFVNIFMAISNAISAYTSQNLGAGLYDRIKYGLYAGVIITSIMSLLSFGICYCFGRELIGLFVDNDNVLDIGQSFLRIISPFYIFVSVKGAVDGVFKGMKDMRMFMTGTFIDLILRVGFAYLLSYLFSSYIGIWYSWPIGWVISSSLVLLIYFMKYRNSNLIQKSAII